MYSFRPIQAPGNNGSAELTIIFLFVLFLLLVSSAATGIYFYTREETNCNKIEKSYDCKFNDNCKWNEDDSECEYDTDTDSDTDSDTDNETGVPYQIPLSTDDYCNDWGKIHQDVPGCGRICSSEDKRGMKTADDDNFVLWSRDADISSECITASEIDKIWEVQSGSSSNRKLADGYTLSNYPTGTSVKCGKNDLRSDTNSVYRVSETGTLRHYPGGDIATSWDPNWGSSKTIGDCKGLTLGDDMATNPSSDPASDPTPYTQPDLSSILTESEIAENEIEGLGPNCKPILTGNSDANLACKAKESKHLCEDENTVSNIVKSGYLSNTVYYKFNELCEWDDEQAEEILDLQASASGDVVNSVSCNSKSPNTNSIPSTVKLKFSGLPSTGYTETIQTVTRGRKSKIVNTETNKWVTIYFYPLNNWEASTPVAERDTSETIYKAKFTFREEGMGLSFESSKEFTVGEETIMAYSFDLDGTTVTAYIEDWLCTDP